MKEKPIITIVFRLGKTEIKDKPTIKKASNKSWEILMIELKNTPLMKARQKDKRILDLVITSEAGCNDCYFNLSFGQFFILDSSENYFGVRLDLSGNCLSHLVNLNQTNIFSA